MRTADRVAVVGDVGGHAEQLEAELIRLGADPVSGRLPAGLVVIQVGDLIHRGPDSAGVVALVDHYLASGPGQWIQLVGNHEAQYLRQPAFEWPEKLPAQTVETLRRWWKAGEMVAAVSVVSAGERFLVTHAGLTRGFWQQVLSAVDDPARAAAALNSFIGDHEDVLFHGGQMLGGGRPNALAGPVWAAAATELLPSWLGGPLPFSQIHGHSTVAGRAAARRTAREILLRTSVDELAAHETTVYEGGRIVGVDPGHARRPRASWRAWLLEQPARLQT
jgi:calcineurin-like phosphoesterase family protein